MAASKTGGGGNVVSLRVEVPKGLAQFVRDLGNFGGSKMSLKSWVESEIVQAANASLDSIDDGEFIQGAVLRKRYGLLEEKDDP